MIVEGMANVQGLDPLLLATVERIETACLCEALQPGALEQFIPPRPSILQEPSDEQMVRVVQAAAITLGGLTAANRVDLATMFAVVENFALSQLHGSEVLASYLRGPEPETFVRQMLHLGQFFTSEASKSIRSAEEMREMLNNRRPASRPVICVAYALAATIGNVVRVRAWHPKDARQIIQRAYDGVFAGEAEREKQGPR